jgi:hypothetical protein
MHARSLRARRDRAAKRGLSISAWPQKRSILSRWKPYDDHLSGNSAEAVEPTSSWLSVWSLAMEPAAHASARRRRLRR